MHLRRVQSTLLFITKQYGIVINDARVFVQDSKKEAKIKNLITGKVSTFYKTADKRLSDDWWTHILKNGVKRADHLI